MRAALRHALWALFVPLLGCGDKSSVEWIPLTLSPGRSDTPLDRVTVPGGRKVEFEERDGMLWGAVEVPREDWLESEFPNALYAPAPLLGLGRPSYRLEIDGRECPPFVASADGPLKLRKNFEPGTFGYWHNAIFLGIHPGESAPARAILRVRLDAGENDTHEYHQVHGRRFSGRGITVWPGQEYARTLDIPAGSLLSFGTSVEAASARQPAESQVTFRIRVNGDIVFEHQQAIDEIGSYAWHSVQVPRASGARIVFEVGGPFAYTTFMDPVVGPAVIGTCAERPWPTHPPIVVFLADTFRADNLALYGGNAEVTPELNRFAEECARFERTWSVGTFTLTGHSSLFSGLYPRQTASAAFSDALPESVETIAEILTRKGYRTGAITDSGVVSLRFGLHQGFSWFDECDLDLASTLERAKDFLDADDGRPAFLFVQTYRAHLPYRAVEPPEEAGKTNNGDAEYRRLMGELLKLGYPKASLENNARAHEIGRDLMGLYRRGATDLDRAFGTFWRDLVARGFPEAGYTLFTSDHGEAFFEHDQLFHQGKVFEEQTRVPLLISGPGVVPRTVHYAASLLDVSPTLASMAGATPLPFWQGANLLELGRERTLFAFECADAETSTIAAVQGAHKLIAREEAGKNRASDLWRAYDLGKDAHETHDLREEAPWPTELFEKASQVIDALLVPLFTGEGSALDQDAIDQLNGLGYNGLGDK